MKKIFTPLIVMAAAAFFGIAASCNMCGIDIKTDATAAGTAQQNAGEQTSAETVKESVTESALNDASATSPEDSGANVQESGNGGSMPSSLDLAPVFAIASTPGDRLLTFYSDAGDAGLQDIDSATGKSGQVYEIEYVSWQEKNENDSGRVVSSNFDNMEGHIYRVIGGELIDNKTYYLFDSHVLDQQHILGLRNPGVANLDVETLARAADLKGRQVQEGWVIGEYDDGTRLLIVVFEPNGQNLLMSIVLDSGGNLKFNDHPATLDGYSAWRVDDGGEINPFVFSVIIAVKTAEGMRMALSWAGAEGENILFLAEDGNSFTELPLDIYRYWSPS